MSVESKKLSLRSFTSRLSGPFLTTLLLTTVMALAAFSRVPAPDFAAAGSETTSHAPHFTPVPNLVTPPAVVEAPARPEATSSLKQLATVVVSSSRP